MLPLPPLGIKELPFFTQNQKTKVATISPNPVDDHALIEFELSSQADVILEITDITGRIAFKSDSRHFPEGIQQIDWNGIYLRNGLYTCRVLAGNEIFTGKFIILKNH